MPAADTTKNLLSAISIDRLSISEWVHQLKPDLVLVLCVKCNSRICKDYVAYLKGTLYEWESASKWKPLVVICNLESSLCATREEILEAMADPEWMVVQNYEDACSIYQSIYSANNPGLPRMVAMKPDMETIVDNEADKTLLAHLDSFDVLRAWDIEVTVNGATNKPKKEKGEHGANARQNLSEDGEEIEEFVVLPKDEQEMKPSVP